MPWSPFLTMVDATLRGVLLALLLLLAAVLRRDRPGAPAAQAGMALCLGLCVQVLGDTPLIDAGVPLQWLAPVVAVSVGNAVLFWVFAQALFDDGFRWRWLHLACWGVAAGVSLVNCLLGAERSSILGPLLFGVQRAVPLVFSLLAVWAAASHWRNDLVERRRRLRVFIVVAGVADALLMLALRLGAPQGRLPPWAASVDVLILLVLASVVAWRMLRFDGGELMPVQIPPPALTRMAPVSSASMAAAPAGAAADDPELPSDPDAVEPPDPAEDRLSERLERLMREERFYRTEDLTIALLARRLGVAEYRLRRLINQRLGHRNFTAYVNGWRLDEAAAALADPERRGVPVLTIALEAGFQSIGPFNRAFKARSGLTPTDYRRQAQPPTTAQVPETLADS